MSISLWCTFQFESWHRWPDAPDQFAYLAHPHRHMFHGRAEWPVSGFDREKEFIDLKHQAVAAVNWLTMHNDTSTWSCEQWAHSIADILKATRVTISEDGENGATVEVEHEP